MRKIIIALAIGTSLLPTVSLAAFDQNLSYGSSGQAVTSLQNFLTAQGFYHGPITGDFFSLTKRALIAFQKQKNIQPATGIFGPTTRGIANSLLTQNATTSIEITNRVTQTQPVSATTSSAPTSWADLEARYFSEATQKGWVSLGITNEAGEKRYYRLEAGTWIRKDTLAEAQQPYQAPPPPNTTLCNGTNWTACPTGQDFVCPASGGKAYCQISQQLTTNTQTETQQNCDDYLKFNQGIIALLKEAQKPGALGASPELYQARDQLQTQALNTSNPLNDTPYATLFKGMTPEAALAAEQGTQGAFAPGINSLQSQIEEANASRTSILAALAALQYSQALLQRCQPR